MFLGTHNPHLDEKGRLILPAKYAAEIEAGIVMVRGQEHCLYVYTAEEFGHIYERLRLAPVTSKSARNYQRLLLAGAHDETPDRQRRITIPPVLRAWANLTRDLAVIGVGDRLEVWDAATWEQHVADTEEGYANVEDEVFPGLI